MPTQQPSFSIRPWVLFLMTALSLAGLDASNAFAHSSHSSHNSGHGHAPHKTSIEEKIQQTKTLTEATALADELISTARESDSPRFYAYTHQLLSQFEEEIDSEPRLLHIRSQISQFKHQFTHAQLDLKQAIRLTPNNSQLWLDLSIAQRLSGEIAASRASCKQLDPHNNTLLLLTCMANSAATKREVQKWYQLLNRAFRMNWKSEPYAVDTDAAHATLYHWSALVLAELAERLGLSPSSEDYYRIALSINPNGETLKAYTEFLMDRHRHQDTLNVLNEYPSDHLYPLLLKALSEKVLKLEQWRITKKRVDQQIEEIKLYNMQSEHWDALAFAAFFLADEPVKQSESALTLARQNWRTQKSFRDLRLLFNIEQLNSEQRQLDVTPPTSTASEWIDQLNWYDTQLEKIAKNARLSTVYQIHSLE